MTDWDLLLPGPTEPRDTWRWATVTATSPLRVRLDGDTAALTVTPDALVSGLTVGARVWCQIVGRRVVIHGHGTPDTGWVPITLAAGFESKSGAPQARRVGARVSLGGLVGAVTGRLPASTMTILGNIPAGFRPSQSEWFACGTTTGDPTATVVVTTAGDIQLRPPGVAVLYVGLGAITYLT